MYLNNLHPSFSAMVLSIVLCCANSTKKLTSFLKCYFRILLAIGEMIKNKLSIEYLVENF